MTFPADDNGDVLRRMLTTGDDLTKPRDIDFDHVFAKTNIEADTYASDQNIRQRPRLDAHWQDGDRINLETGIVEPRITWTSRMENWIA